MANPIGCGRSSSLHSGFLNNRLSLTFVSSGQLNPYGLCGIIALSAASLLSATIEGPAPRVVDSRALLEKAHQFTNEKVVEQISRARPVQHPGFNLNAVKVVGS